MRSTASELRLSDKESQTQRWYEHFNEVLNRENPSNPVSIVKIEAANGNEEIDTSEIKEATKHLKNRKAPCIYNIRAELLKADIDFATIKVKEIIYMVKLPKKDNLKECKS